MVNIRRLQRTGGESGSSFLIILPKDWVERQGLSKGHPVVVAEREDGCLIVDPRLSKAGEPRSTSIQIESNLRWVITSKYLLGFDEIHVVSSKKITGKQRLELERIIKRFVALEITEEDENEIVIRCLVDPSTLPVRKTMKRMNLLASRMLDDAVDAFFEGDKKSADYINQRDEEVDRLFFLIVRELRSAIQYPRMSEIMSIAPVEALDFRLAAQYIERIADLSVEIASHTTVPVDTRMRKKIELIVAQVKEMLSKSVANLFAFDSNKVSWVIEAEKELGSNIAKARDFLLSKADNEPQSQLYVLDILLRIGETAKDIVDLALPQS
ncbi:MAG: phosphate uptake regulator PhoU [Candidatus Thorarchaeota archaeon]|nr:phosphate uptake regulator PhoU [Candidatus Thorarchaeota archaeon]